jgi:hypothetical protein
MAVDQTITTQTITTIQETAADEIIIRRVPIKNIDTGKIDITFTATIFYSTQEYQGTSATDRTEAIRTLNTGSFTLTGDQVAGLFGIPLTLSDGSAKILGDLIGDEADKLIAADMLMRLRGRIKPALSFVNSSDGLTVTVSAYNQPDVIYDWSVVSGDVTLAASNTNSIVATPVSKPFTLECKATYTKDNTIFETNQVKVI